MYSHSQFCMSGDFTVEVQNISFQLFFISLICSYIVKNFWRGGFLFAIQVYCKHEDKTQCSTPSFQLFQLNLCQAAEHGISELSFIIDADDRFLFVISDANLRRYGISPRTLGNVLISKDSVHASAIFIASFDDEVNCGWNLCFFHQKVAKKNYFFL